MSQKKKKKAEGRVVWNIVVSDQCVRWLKIATQFSERVKGLWGVEGT